MSTDAPKLKASDFKNDQNVRWCPGCGDYAILSAVQKTMPQLGLPKEDIVFISGIGCSSRFPYYMNTYGFHTIHGRAPAFATGLKTSRPELSVWVITGDGDSLSIGGNHLIHVLRRNVDLQILLFNNQIYGLTKGQYSPTSEVGKRTKSTPMGSIDNPFKPLSLALGAEATFIARTIDRDPKHMSKILLRSAAHKGTALIEIYQNCNIFNDGAFAHLTERSQKAENILPLEHGQPLVFGPNKEHGIVFDNFEAKVVEVDSVGLENIHVHDEKGPMAYHMILASMGRGDDLPTPIGVIRATERAVYNAAVNEQVALAKKQKGPGTLNRLLNAGQTWTVE